MKTTITCDELFDRLTRAPFPGDEPSDARVEEHLAACHECRRLAEALRPAVGLFHEALCEERAALPAYHGETATGVERTCCRLGAEPQPREAAAFGASSAQWWSLDRSRMLWLTALAAAACLLAVGWASGDPLRQLPRSADGRPDARPLPDRDVVAWLDTLGLPPACREADVPDTMEGSELREALRTYCCTGCHGVDRPASASRAAIGKVTAACLACHTAAIPEPRRSKGLNRPAVPTWPCRISGPLAVASES